MHIIKFSGQMKSQKTYSINSIGKRLKQQTSALVASVKHLQSIKPASNDSITISDILVTRKNISFTISYQLPLHNESVSQQFAFNGEYLLFQQFEKKIWTSEILLHKQTYLPPPLFPDLLKGEHPVVHLTYWACICVWFTCSRQISFKLTGSVYL